PADADEQMRAAGASGLLYAAEHRRRDGSVFPVEISACGGRVGGEDVILQVIRDVTERRQAADEHRALQGLFEQSQKLDTLGRLAGSVAHDFNNLLQVILGITDLLLDETAPAERSAPQLREIRDAAEKARILTQQLLLFSRRDPATPQALNCNSVVREVEPVLRRLLPPNIQVVLHLVDKAPPIRVHAGQLQQVLMNLALNARDAMPAGGQLTIETEHVVLTAADTARHPDLEAKPYVRLLVGDTGVGLSPEARAHLFEPFFTTKAPGEGAGLGLATVYGIVKQWGGAIIPYSEPDRGTAFKIYLPVMPDETASGSAGPEKGAEPTPLEGSETVLLAEDDAGVRRMTARALRKFGYEVIEAEDGAEALRKAAAAAKPVQVLVTDLVMPEVGGRELADRLQEQQPDVKIIFISGFSEKGAWARGLLPPGAVFLSKPFALAELVRMIRDQCGAAG
ncbi:MAG: response regulator, partial [Candidatus Marinimicrobia bacterium]|nr:response regulator [Candidatus Neomarinimicrobiota bacterium]